MSGRGRRGRGGRRMGDRELRQEVVQLKREMHDMAGKWNSRTHVVTMPCYNIEVRIFRTVCLQNVSADGQLVVNIADMMQAIEPADSGFGFVALMLGFPYLDFLSVYCYYGLH